MRGILFILFFGLSQVAAANIIGYSFAGSLEKIGYGTSEDLNINFSVNSDTWVIEDIYAEFRGQTWGSIENKETKISIWSDTPEFINTYWFEWNVELTNNLDVLKFLDFPEWKLHLHDGDMEGDPLAYLDQSFFVSQLVTFDDGEFFGLSGNFIKTFTVDEPASLYLLALSLGLMIIFGVFNDSKYIFPNLLVVDARCCVT